MATVNRRSIKRSPAGEYSRERVRVAVKGTHVLQGAAHGSWVVRTLGERGVSRIFETKEKAIDFALKLEPKGKVLVHQREPKRVLMARPNKRTGQVTLEEAEKI